MFLGVHVDPRDENAVDALEVIQRLAALRPAPDGVAGDPILPLGKDQRDVQVDAGRCQFFQGRQARLCGRHLDQPVDVPASPMLAQFDVFPDALIKGRGERRIFQQRVQFEADVAVIAMRPFPDRQKHVLGLPDQIIRHFPGDRGIVHAFVDQTSHVLIEAARFQDIRDDDRVGGGAGRAQNPVSLHQLRIDGIQPELGSGGDQ